jgi:hypothetical protein
MFLDDDDLYDKKKIETTQRVFTDNQVSIIKINNGVMTLGGV